jgi:hypothetical protein
VKDIGTVLLSKTGEHFQTTKKAPFCHPQRSKGPYGAVVIPSEAKDLMAISKRFFTTFLSGIAGFFTVLKNDKVRFFNFVSIGEAKESSFSAARDVYNVLS